MARSTTLQTHFVRQKPNAFHVDKKENIRKLQEAPAKIEAPKKKPVAIQHSSSTQPALQGSIPVVHVPAVSSSQDLSLNTVFNDTLIPPFDNSFFDIDKAMFNAKSMSEYAPRIMDSLFKQETRIHGLICPTFIESVQAKVKTYRLTNKAFTVVVDWLIELAREFSLQRETLFLGVHLLCRLLSRRMCGSDKIQLVGAGCLYLACKYEQSAKPCGDDFAYASGDAFEVDELIRMESTIANELDFEITVPTARTFLKRFCQAGFCEVTEAHLAAYLTELTLLDPLFLKFKPSLIAATAVGLARYTNKGSFWSATLAHYTRYSQAELKECAKEMLSAWRFAFESADGNLYSTYSRRRHQRVSLTPVPEMAWLEAL
ncbi:CyclinA [Carpediemonas membranifera]|uniref:CyclinA n=1 Tax=Carpediemonas membranifera TaxID=201153 RepID=A0A8J6BU33_9EUKA|nr:CyclinA [Carpediemonas membranifera]|eukprot:KAG9389931.1 CyclinA [Carpediemonas membranifera]